MVQVASRGFLFGSGPTLTSGRQYPALVHGARWEPRAYPACVGGGPLPRVPPSECSPGG